MKKISIIAIILISFGVTFAQTDLIIQPNWQKFAPDGEEFIVEIPQKMQESINWSVFDEQKYNYSFADYRLYFNGVYYFIFSDKLTPKKAVMNYDLSEPLKSFITEFNKEPEIIKFSDFNGTKYEFKDSEDFYHTIIYVKTNNHFYRIHTIREENISDDAKRFLNSIHFFGEVLKPKTYEEKFSIISLNRDDYFNFPEWKTFAQSQPKPADISVSTPLKLISKPRANYTDLARSYFLTGTIIFNVEFLSNGEIGKIIPLKRLPFGMMTSTIKAVKGIKFEPSMKDGVPTTVVKQVQYHFSLL